MKDVILKVPEKNAEEFVKKLSQLMNECGAEVKNDESSYNPEEGDFVVIDETYIAIFQSFDGGTMNVFAYYDTENDDSGYNDILSCKTVRPATDEEKEQLVKVLAQDGKKWDAEQKDFEDCETYEAIRTFEDAVKFTGMTLPFDENDESIPADIIVYAKLRIITAAINGQTKDTLAEFPKFTPEEWRYFPWFYLVTKEEMEEMSEEDRGRCVGRAYNDAFANGGCVCAYANIASSHSYAGLGARLAFKTQARAKFAGVQFKELFADFYFLPNPKNEQNPE